MDFQLMLENAHDEDERKGIIMVEACEVGMERANLALNTYNKVHELEKRARQIKEASMSQSGSFDDMVAFYEESATKAVDNGKKKNLILRAWDAIKKWWESLRKKFSKMIHKKTATTGTVSLPKETFTFRDKILNMVGSVKSVISNHKALTVGIIGGAIAAIGAVVVAAKAIKSRKDQVNVDATQAQKVAEDIDKATDKVTEIILDLGKVEAEVAAPDYSEYDVDDGLVEKVSSIRNDFKEALSAVDECNNFIWDMLEAAEETYGESADDNVNSSGFSSDYSEEISRILSGSY